MNFLYQFERGPHAPSAPPAISATCQDNKAGPGVGISNFEVRFRDAEMARMWNSDYRIRVHRSRNDSHMNEAERTNSAIGDALVDGGTIEWERHRLFDGLTDDQISQLTLNEFEEHQRQIIRCSQQIGWRTCSRRIYICIPNPN